MRSRRAGHVVARPLNCGVMRPIDVIRLALGASANANGSIDVILDSARPAAPHCMLRASAAVLRSIYWMPRKTQTEDAR